MCRVPPGMAYNRYAGHGAFMKDLPQFLQELINSPPMHGQGVHQWMFKVARNLHAHWPAGDIVKLIVEKTAKCGRAIPLREVTAAVTQSIGCAWQPKDGNTGVEPYLPKPQSKWPKCDEGYRKFVIQEHGYGLADLFEASPMPISDSGNICETVIDHLFPGNPLLCCGLSSSHFQTKGREEWRGILSAQQLIVPSPMTSPTGHTKEGKVSAHCLENTGPRRFLVCEFDSGTADEQAALLLNLRGYAPLVMAVHSGSKSIHGWFYCAHALDKQVGDFFQYACKLGADPATWTRSQFVRMPDGTRDNGNRQSVYYLNLSPLIR